MSKKTIGYIGMILLLASGLCAAQVTPVSPGDQGTPSLPQNPIPVAAPNAVPSSSVTVFPNDDENFQDDRITYSNDIAVSVVTTGVSPVVATPACLPAFSTLVGKQRASLNATGIAGWLFRVDQLGINAGARCKDPAVVRIAGVGDTVWIAEADVLKYDPTRTGWAFGGLVVPYKYHLGGDRNFSGGASVGFYGGYRFSTDAIRNVKGGAWPRGIDITIAGFFGPTTTSVKETVDGKEKSNSLTGASLGVAFTARVKSSFEAGVVVGIDYFGRNSGYANNGKVWIAAAIGFPFTQ